MTTRRPDAFEVMVEKHWRKKLAASEPGSIVFFQPWDIEGLLRAQHAKVRRMVKGQRDKGKDRTTYQSKRETGCAVISAYTLACDDILAALDRMKQGKGKG